MNRSKDIVSVFPFLSCMTNEELALLGAPSLVRAGTVMLSQGVSCSRYLLLLEGQARVYRASTKGREFTYLRLEAGEGCFLTASCILSGHVFPANLRSETELTLLPISSSVFLFLLERYQEWRDHVFGAMGKFVRTALDVAESSMLVPLEQRVAQYLLLHLEGEAVVKTHEEISQELNSTREVISRVLKAFERRKIIRLSRGKVLLRDSSELEKFLNGV